MLLNIYSMERSMDQLILGSLLGDMFIGKHSTNARIMIRHSMKQTSHVMMKYDILKEYVLTPPKPVKSKGFSKEGFCFCFNTKSSPVFTEYHNFCYPGGKKKVTREWLDRLTPEGLAYWYMDDGSVGISNAQIATYSFSYEEHLTIKEYFEQKWGIIVSIKNRCNKKYYGIYMVATERNKFCRLISPYIIPSMTYKIKDSDIIKKCVVCDNEFITSYPAIVTCSEDCSKENQKIIYHDKYDNNPEFNKKIRDRSKAQKKKIKIKLASDPIAKKEALAKRKLYRQTKKNKDYMRNYKKAWRLRNKSI